MKIKIGEATVEQIGQAVRNHPEDWGKNFTMELQLEDDMMSREWRGMIDADIRAGDWGSKTDVDWVDETGNHYLLDIYDGGIDWSSVRSRDTLRRYIIEKKGGLKYGEGGYFGPDDIDIVVKKGRYGAMASFYLDGKTIRHPIPLRNERTIEVDD